MMNFDDDDKLKYNCIQVEPLLLSVLFYPGDNFLGEPIVLVLIIYDPIY